MMLMATNTEFLNRIFSLNSLERFHPSLRLFFSHKNVDFHFRHGIYVSFLLFTRSLVLSAIHCIIFSRSNAREFFKRFYCSILVITLLTFSSKKTNLPKKLLEHIIIYFKKSFIATWFYNNS